MTAVDAGAGGTVQPAAEQEAAAEAAPTGLMAGDPMMLGLPTFIAGSVALGLVLVGAQVPVGTFGAALAIVLAATAVGLWISTVWAIAIGQSAVAAVFGIFGAFWLSFAVLVVAVDHNWFAFVTPASRAGPAASVVTGAIQVFLITWLVIIVMLTLATLRLPLVFVSIFVLVDLALIFVLAGVSNASTGQLRTAGVFVFIFAALGVYAFFSAAQAATGGKPLPLGRPLLK